MDTPVELLGNRVVFGHNPFPLALYASGLIAPSKHPILHLKRLLCPFRDENKPLKLRGRILGLDSRVKM